MFQQSLKGVLNKKIFRGGGIIMNLEVKCNVKNCTYWADGDQCVADSIYVIGPHGSRMAVSVEETACKTFEHRE
jgi:hypothetical protein